MKTTQAEPHAKAAHTPGPWRILSQVNADFQGWEIRETQSNGASGMKIAGSISKEANARLIAAAPELLTWLKYAVEADNHWHSNDCAASDPKHDCDCWVAKARAAISKVTGGAE